MGAFNFLSCNAIALIAIITPKATVATLLGWEAYLKLRSSKSSWTSGDERLLT